MWMRALFPFLLLGFLCLPIFGASLPQFQRELAAHIEQKKFSEAAWGIKIVSLDSGTVLFETNAQKLLKPASNAKVFTAALALDALGPDYRIRTSLFAERKPNANGILNGDLIVYGRGDPSFAARFRGGSYSNLLGEVVAALRAAGVKRIEGDLVGDETFFSGPRFGAGWTWEDLQFYYGAEVSALSVQDNVVDLLIRPGSNVGAACAIGFKPERTEGLEFVNRTRTTATNVAAAITVSRAPVERRVYVSGTLPRNHGGYSDAVTMPNPARWFMTLLREALAKEGILVSGQTRTRSWPEDARLKTGDFKEIAFTESVPVSEIVEKMLKPSQNLYAQLLWLQVGAKAKGPGSTEDAGTRAMRAFVKRAGIDPSEVLLEEGAGLSRTCLVTPNALAELLRYMARHPHGAMFRGALPGPNEGTLRNRLREFEDSGLKAKTGMLKYVTTLSGYVQSGAGERLAFAVMLNGYDNPGATSARDEVETVVRSLKNLQERTGPRAE